MRQGHTHGVTPITRTRAHTQTKSPPLGNYLILIHVVCCCVIRLLPLNDNKQML
jgi:hypothetical protein